MKACTDYKYSLPEVLELENVKKAIPKENEVLLKVIAVIVSTLDYHFRSGKPFMARLMVGGLRKPEINILGFDVCGEAEEIGLNVSRFKNRDLVYDCSGPGCQGVNTEYTIMPDKDLLLKPSVLSDIE